MNTEIETIPGIPEAAYKRMSDGLHMASGGYVEFCLGAADAVRGKQRSAGKKTQAAIGEEFGMSRSAVAKAVVIGNADPRVVRNPNISKDKDALYSLANAYTKHGDGVLEWLSAHPQPTHKVVKEFIEVLEPKKEKPVDTSTVGWMEAAQKKIGPDIPGWKTGSLRASTSDKKEKIEAIIGEEIPVKTEDGKPGGRVGPELAEKIADAAYQIALEEQPEALAKASLDVTLSMTAQQKLEAALRKRTAELQVEFKQSVDRVVAEKLAEKQKELDEAIARYRKLGDELKEKNRAMEDRAANLATIISEDEYKRITSCLHPDRHPGEEEKYNKASQSWRKITHSSRMEFTSWTKNVFEDHGWTKDGARKIMKEKIARH